MQFSRAVDYAIHGLLALCRAEGATLTLVDIARTTAVPKEYLRKVFRQLQRRGLVTAKRGVAGGYRLARSPSVISLRDVVDCVEGGVPRYACVAHLQGCGTRGKCAVRDVFAHAARGMSDTLGGTTLAEVMSQVPRRVPPRTVPAPSGARKG
jgi:Rrf2 family protein